MKKEFLIGIRVRKDCPQAMESQIGIAALFRDFVLSFTDVEGAAHELVE